MVQIAFTGLAHYRIITKSDLKQAGFEDDVLGDFTELDLVRPGIERALNLKNKKNVGEVPQEVAEFLMEVEPGEWEIVKDDVSPSAPSGDAGTAAGDSGASDAPTADIAGEAGISASAGSTSRARAR